MENCPPKFPKKTRLSGSPSKLLLKHGMEGSRKVLADQRFRNTGTVFATKLTPQEMQELEEILTEQPVQTQMLEQTRIQEEMRAWAHAQAQMLEHTRIQEEMRAWAQALEEKRLQEWEQAERAWAQALEEKRLQALKQAEFALRFLGIELVQEIFLKDSN